jgi:hypothetical protein
MEIKKRKINETHGNQQKTNGTNEKPMEIKKKGKSMKNMATNRKPMEPMKNQWR